MKHNDKARAYKRIRQNRHSRAGSGTRGGVEIISTGGTFKTLSGAGINVTNISDITGFPECLDGRVKTLHPMVHAGLLAIRSNEDHMKQLKELGIEPIDMVVINLYPFKQTILRDGVTLEEAIENIDIGGPTMLRAAAKNYQDVAVVVDPADYGKVLEEIESSGDVSAETKFRLAYKVFEHTSHYDTLIAGYLRKGWETHHSSDIDADIREGAGYEIRGKSSPEAVFYREVGANKGCLTNAKQLHGKELSYNNINDANGALELLKEFDEPAVIVTKHANPCGAASGADIYEAYVRAFEADPVSAFGGIVALNREVDASTAAELKKVFYEIIIAPSFSPSSEILTAETCACSFDITAKLPAGHDMKKSQVRLRTGLQQYS